MASLGAVLDASGRLERERLGLGIGGAGGGEGDVGELGQNGGLRFSLAVRVGRKGRSRRLEEMGGEKARKSRLVMFSYNLFSFAEKAC